MLLNWFRYFDALMMDGDKQAALHIALLSDVDVSWGTTYCSGRSLINGWTFKFFILFGGELRCI